jgi:hypothetical protein
MTDAVKAPAAATAQGLRGIDQQGSSIVSEDNRTPSANQELEFHPLANLFPLMKGEEYDALVADIKANGLHEVIITHQGMILDGRNRYRACLVAGVKPNFFDFQSTFQGQQINDPAAFVISANIHRRHLTAEQRRDLIAKLLKEQPEKSNRQIAKTAKVDDKTVGAVRREMESTAEIPQLEKTVGADGKVRKQPAKKSKAAKAERNRKARERREAARAAERKRMFEQQEAEEAEAEAKAEHLAADLIKAGLAQRVLAYVTWEDDPSFLLDALRRLLSPDDKPGEGNDVDPESSAEAMKAQHAALDDGIPEILRRAS